VDRAAFFTRSYDRDGMTIRTLLLAACLVLAGCGGLAGGDATAPAQTGGPASATTALPSDDTPPTSDEPSSTDGPPTSDAPPSTDAGTADPTTTTPTPDRDEVVVAVTGSPDPPVNESALFLDVRDLLDQDTTPPGVVVTDDPPLSVDRTSRVTDFRYYLLPGPNDRPTAGDGGDWPVPSLAFYDARNHTVYVHPDAASADAEAVRTLLVEEFAHAVQFRNGTFQAYYDGMVDGRFAFDDDLTVDERYATTAIREGVGDVYVTVAYQRDVLDTPRNARLHEVIATNYLYGSVGYRLTFGPYLAGYRYANATVDDPDDTFALYRDAPETSEQVIHRTDDQPVPLAVAVDDPDLTTTRTRTYGELFLRSVLTGGLTNDDAHAAAAGWGNDRLLELDHATDDGTTTGYVWTLRFDDAANASTFESAIQNYLDARATAVDGDTYTIEDQAWRATRVDDRTVALVVGPEAFTDAVTVTSENATGTVTVAT
jgi:hypothetical protein